MSRRFFYEAPMISQAERAGLTLKTRMRFNAQAQGTVPPAAQRSLNSSQK